jgi:hypothetical protein
VGLLLLAGLVLVAAAAPGGDGVATRPPSVWSKDPRSGAALNRLAAGIAPFAGSFGPEEPLSDLAGEDQEGGWVLRTADTEAGDTGTVGCIQLRIRSA